MCGICGTVGFGSDETLERMTGALRHRGPDDSGAVRFGPHNVGLGHRRLSIIDLSPAGREPMENEDGSVWLVFNGEIYNFMDLRRRLEGRGHRFRSSTDAEVVLHLYEDEGPDCVGLLRGMFALALYDVATHRLLIARDHIGVKPVYYWTDGSRFAFGSEIKAILASGIPTPDIDWQAIADYFTFLFVPGPRTAFQGIRQVRPGHLLEVDLESGRVEEREFWRPHADGPVEASFDEQARDLRVILANSVREQLVSDVPLGILLSGGIDSAIVTALAAGSSEGTIKTFTVVFEDPGLENYDERDRARATASRFGTDHLEIPVRIDDPAAMLDLGRFFDQPFANPTLYLMHLISRASREEVKVALCGAGGDELFAGYPRYRADALARRLTWLPRPIVDAGRWALSLPTDRYRGMGLRRAREFLEGLGSDPLRRFTAWTYFTTEDGKRRLLLDHIAGGEPAERIVREAYARAGPGEHGNRLLTVDLQTFLPDNLLAYTDRMSMAHGLEVRVPVVDVRMVERSLAVPFAMKLRGATTKRILKHAFADVLPKEVASGPKRGFNAPLGRWLREGLDTYFDRSMSPHVLRRDGIFRPEEISRLRAEHRAGKRDNSHELFSIIVFDVWFRTYVTHETSIPGHAPSRPAVKRVDG